MVRQMKTLIISLLLATTIQVGNKTYEDVENVKVYSTFIAFRQAGKVYSVRKEGTLINKQVQKTTRYVKRPPVLPRPPKKVDTAPVYTGTTNLDWYLFVKKQADKNIERTNYFTGKAITGIGAGSQGYSSPSSPPDRWDIENGEDPLTDFQSDVEF